MASLDIALPQPTRNPLAAVLGAIVHGIRMARNGDRYVAEIAALHRLDDAQLAARGLTRDDISRHVLRDVLA